MKNFIKLSHLLLALLLPATTLAHDFEVDGIYYNIINGNEASVTSSPTSSKYTGDVTIPAIVTYNGMTYSVTTIGNYAFYECNGLTSLDIPNSVTTIEDHAVEHCTDLISTSIGNSVTTIGNNAFCACERLTSVTIPNSVITIGEGAFSYCI